MLETLKSLSQKIASDYLKLKLADIMDVNLNTTNDHSNGIWTFLIHVFDGLIIHSQLQKSPPSS